MEFLQVSSLTTGLDEVKGNNGVDTINASATSATGTDITTISSGDSIDGGAGKDTLNITATADNNNSLTGVTVKNVEVINLSGANNIGATVTSTPTVAAGAKQVQTIDVTGAAALTGVAEQQTVNFGDLTVGSATAAGNIKLAGVEFAVAAGDTAAMIAAKAVTAINTAADASSASGVAATIDSVSNVGGLMTIVFKEIAGDVPAVAFESASSDDAAYLSTTGVTALSGVTISETVAASVERQKVVFGSAGDHLVSTGTGSLTLAGVSVTSVAAGSTDAKTVAALVSALNTANTSSGSTIERFEDLGSGELQIVYKATAGNVTAAATATGTASVNTILTSGSATATSTTTEGLRVNVDVDIDGNVYEVTGVQLDKGIYDTLELAASASTGAKTTAAAAVTAAKIVGANNLRDAVISTLNDYVGGDLIASNGDDAGEVKITSEVTGAAIPTVTLVQGETTLSTIDSADPFTVANKVTTAAAAVAQIKTISVANADTNDTFELVVDGASFGTITYATSAAATVKAIADAINVVLGDGTALAVGTKITMEAPVAGTPLPNVTLKETEKTGSDLAITYATTRDNVVVGASASTATSGAISAASFVGSDEIWLKGTGSNEVAVSGLSTQVLGLSGTTGMDSSAAFTGTSATIYTDGASGDLALTGTKVATVAVVGKSGTLDLSHATATALTVSTSGTATIDARDLDALKTVVSSGEGAANLRVGTTVESITTGEGADRSNLVTATAKDNVATTTDETVSASLSTGAGNDTVNIATTGDGITTVDTGAGDDTLFLTAIASGSTGYNVNAGAGNDTVVRSVAMTAKTKIDGGDGVDTLMIGGDTFDAADYVLLETSHSNFESVAFTSAVGGLDASKLNIGNIATISFHDGVNVITEASASLLVTGRAKSTVSTDGITPAVATMTDASKLTASSLGYDAGTSPVKTDFGGNLTVTADSAAEGTVALVLNANTANVNVKTGVYATTNTTPTTDVTVTGDLKDLNVNLSSTQIAGATAATLAAASASHQAAATINVTVADSADAAGLNSLEKISVSGSGVAVIDAGAGDPEVGVADSSDQETALTSIDLSGMTAQASINYLGKQITASGAGSAVSTSYGYKNLSTSNVTLNDAVIETLTLGGAQDTVTTTSVIDLVDTIIGFELVADVEDADNVDAAKSDIIKLSGTWNAATILDDDTYATMNEGLLAAAASGTANQVFIANGDTYLYQDIGTAGLTADDHLIKLSGVYDLALLIQVIG